MHRMGVLVDQQTGGIMIMPPPKKKWIRHYLLGKAEVLRLLFKIIG